MQCFTCFTRFLDNMNETPATIVIKIMIKADIDA